MRLRSIPDTFAPQVVHAIDAALAGIGRDHAASIPLAIESGSRAWGFPSPDSDYDCRFVFIRQQADYLSPWPKRDVIELPLSGDLDINGWDIQKAVRLLLKGNAVIIEWLQSPIQYGVEAAFQDDFLQLAAEIADRDRIARHYAHIAERQHQLHLARGEAVPIKKLFYVLRPLLALRWLRQHPDQRFPPMHFLALMSETDLPAHMQETLATLIGQKAATPELGRGAILPAITAFIEGELAAGRTKTAARPTPPPRAHVAAAEAFCLRAITGD